jgi:hypothetical protein
MSEIHSAAVVTGVEATVNRNENKDSLDTGLDIPSSTVRETVLPPESSSEPRVESSVSLNEVKDFTVPLENSASLNEVKDFTVPLENSASLSEVKDFTVPLENSASLNEVKDFTVPLENSASWESDSNYSVLESGSFEHLQSQNDAMETNDPESSTAPRDALPAAEREFSPSLHGESVSTSEIFDNIVDPVWNVLNKIADLTEAPTTATLETAQEAPESTTATLETAQEEPEPAAASYTDNIDEAHNLFSEASENVADLFSLPKVFSEFFKFAETVPNLSWQNIQLYLQMRMWAIVLNLKYHENFLPLYEHLVRMPEGGLIAASIQAIMSAQTGAKLWGILGGVVSGAFGFTSCLFGSSVKQVLTVTSLTSSAFERQTLGLLREIKDAQQNKD